MGERGERRGEQQEKTVKKILGTQQFMSELYKVIVRKEQLKYGTLLNFVAEKNNSSCYGRQIYDISLKTIHKCFPKEN